MNFDVNMTNRQKVAIGVQILDQDAQPYTTLPEGASVTFTSDNPTVATVTPREDGFNADVASGQVGSARISVHAEGFNDPVTNTPIAIEDDLVRVIVRNSAPGRLNTTVGAPEDE